jgi:hypothetical protein
LAAERTDKAIDMPEFRDPHDIVEAFRSASVDTYPDAPGDAPFLTWVYDRRDYAAGLLSAIVARGHAAGLFVDYAENHRRPRGRLIARVAASSMRFRVSPGVSWSTDAATVVGEDGWVEATPAGGGTVSIEVAAEGGAAALAVPLHDSSDWTVVRDDGVEVPALLVDGGDVPPHLAEEPLVMRSTTDLGSGLYELDVPGVGHPLIEAEFEPTLTVGESMDEAEWDGVGESRTNVIRVGERLWTTVDSVGCRYLRVAGGAPTSVRFRASVHPVPRRGAFLCSDQTLNRVWDSSALTLRLCMQRLVVDGIKRDRMPWAGDQALNTLSNAYAFGDAEIVRDGLVALGSPTEGFVNGIVDYSLWWLVNALELRLYLGAPRPEGDEVEQIDALTRGLAELADPTRGVLRPATVEDPNPWVLIDWGYEVRGDADNTALQMLWYWALRSAFELMSAIGHADAERWRVLADRVRATVRSEGWDDEHGRWIDHLGMPDSGASAYPNLVAAAARWRRWSTGRWTASSSSHRGWTPTNSKRSHGRCRSSCWVVTTRPSGMTVSRVTTPPV